jgi:serine protease AprX
VQAFDELGQGSYADVIRAIDWVVANKAAHNIRVLNLSFSAEPRSHYWDDPINQAVMSTRR